jgi:hypothetical protein
MGDPTYRAPVQRSNIHGNGEGLSGDVQFGSQCDIQKALIGSRLNEDPETFGLVSPQQNDMKKAASKASKKVPHMAHKSTRSYR